VGVSISVIVPVYNSRELLRHCLESIHSSTVKPDEIIVVDDGSNDGSPHVARALGARVLYTGTRAAGPAVARNIGAANAWGDILFFTDADCLLHPDTLDRVKTLFEREDSPDAVIGSYDLRPLASNYLSQYRNLLHAYVHQTSSEDAHTFWGGCGAIRKSRFVELNGFDTRLYKRPSIEDIELGYRLKASGGHILLDKDMLVTHCKRWAPVNLVRTDVRDRGIPWMRLILRSNSAKSDLNLKLRDRISVVLIYLMMLGLVGMFLSPVIALVSSGMALAMFWFHLDLYRYFRKHGSLWFVIYCMFWHWLYYFFNGISFLIGIGLHFRDMISGELEQFPIPESHSTAEHLN